ncbi:unnamed protein product, partial [Polarella glacialis]
MCGQDCRLFATGLGWGASPPFVEGAAQAGRGTYAFVADRGGAFVLERALVAQLTEALQPVVRDVEVRWESSFRADAVAPEDEPVGLTRPQGEDEQLLQRFVKQGGLRTVHSAAVPLQDMDSGNRLLALALLGVGGSGGATESLTVRATVGGRPVVTEVAAPRYRTGVSLHTLSAQRLVNATESGKSGAESADQSWLSKALGLGYSLSTAETHWVALSVEDVVGNSSVLAASLPQAVQCTAARGTEGARAPTREALRGQDLSLSTKAAPSKEKDPDEKGGGPELFVRHPPGPIGEKQSQSGRGGGPSAKGVRVASRLSVLDFTNLGASLSLRTVAGKGAPRGRGAEFSEQLSRDDLHWNAPLPRKSPPGRLLEESLESAPMTAGFGSTSLRGLTKLGTSLSLVDDLGLSDTFGRLK